MDEMIGVEFIVSHKTVIAGVIMAVLFVGASFWDKFWRKKDK